MVRSILALIVYTAMAMLETGCGADTDSPAHLPTQWVVLVDCSQSVACSRPPCNSDVEFWVKAAEEMVFDKLDYSDTVTVMPIAATAQSKPLMDETIPSDSLDEGLDATQAAKQKLLFVREEGPKVVAKALAAEAPRSQHTAIVAALGRISRSGKRLRILALTDGSESTSDTDLDSTLITRLNLADLVTRSLRHADLAQGSLAGGEVAFVLNSLAVDVRRTPLNSSSDLHQYWQRVIENHAGGKLVWFAAQAMNW